MGHVAPILLGLAGGALLAAAAVVWDRILGAPVPLPPLCALAAVVAAALLLTQHTSWRTVVAVALGALAAAVPRGRALAKLVQAALVIGGIALLAGNGAWRLDNTGRAILAAGAAVVVVGAMVTVAHGAQLSLLAPLVVSMAGLFLLLPDTEPPLLVAATLVPVALVLGVVGEVPLDGRRFVVGGAAPALLFVAVAASESSAVPDPRYHLTPSTIGGLACAGVLVAWALARLLVWARPGLPRVPWPVLAVLQVPAVIVIARAGVVRHTAARATEVSGYVLGTLTVLLLVIELVIHVRARRIRRAREAAHAASDLLFPSHPA